MKMKKYEKPQMKVFAVASRLLLNLSTDQRIKTNPTEEGDGEVL